VSCTRHKRITIATSASAAAHALLGDVDVPRQIVKTPKKGAKLQIVKEAAVQELPVRILDAESWKRVGSRRGRQQRKLKLGQKFFFRMIIRHFL
jgi:hypothetical protein